MSNVISLEEYKEAQAPHMSGNARCIACGHTWVAVAPVGVSMLECPECKTYKGVFNETTMMGDVRFMCNCGCDIFRIHPEAGAYCAVCGAVAGLP